MISFEGKRSGIIRKGFGCPIVSIPPVPLDLSARRYKANGMIVLFAEAQNGISYVLANRTNKKFNIFHFRIGLDVCLNKIYQNKTKRI